MIDNEATKLLDLMCGPYGLTCADRGLDHRMIALDVRAMRIDA
jgi:hypothetical protein